MMQMKFNFSNFIFYGVCLPQLGSVPSAYAVVAGGCDWSSRHSRRPYFQGRRSIWDRGDTSPQYLDWGHYHECPPQYF